MRGNGRVHVGLGDVAAGRGQRAAGVGQPLRQIDAEDVAAVSPQVDRGQARVEIGHRGLLAPARCAERVARVEQGELLLERQPNRSGEAHRRRARGRPHEALGSVQGRRGHGPLQLLGGEASGRAESGEGGEAGASHVRDEGSGRSRAPSNARVWLPPAGLIGSSAGAHA